MSENIRDFFVVEEAARLSGLTRSMVDYLCRTKILMPTYPQKYGRGRGRERRYSFGDVIVLRALARMLQAGVSVLGLKKALGACRRYHPEITPVSSPGAYLVTDGERVYFRSRRSSNGLEELLSGQFVFAFVVEVEAIKGEVLKQLVVERKRGNVAGFHYRLRSTA